MCFFHFLPLLGITEPRWHGWLAAALVLLTVPGMGGADELATGLDYPHADVKFTTGGDTPAIAWRRAEDGPAAWSAGAMTYNTRSQRMILHHASVRSSQRGASTFEFDGDTWRLLHGGAGVARFSSAGVQYSTPTPDPRARFSLGYDPVRDRVVLSGEDTWEWDGNSWARKATVGVVAGALVYDAKRQVMMGISTWTTMRWDGNTWHAICPTDPAEWLVAAYDCFRGVIVKVSKPQNGAEVVTEEWTGEQWRTVSRFETLPAASNAMVYFDSHTRETMLVLSPKEAGAWTWNGLRWGSARVPGIPFAGAYGFDQHRKTAVLLSGSTHWEVAGGGVNRRDMGIRVGFATAYDSTRQRTVLFGGYTSGESGSTPHGDTWEWDGQRWTQIANSGPSPRYASAMAYDRNRQRMVLFGGRGKDVNHPPNDTWEWDGDNWELINHGPGPPARPLARMVYDPVARQTLLYGSSAPWGSRGLSHLWGWDGAEWRLLAQWQSPSDGPTNDGGFDIVYNESRQRAQVYGGYRWGHPEPYYSFIPTYTPLAELWEWNGTGWALQPSTGMGPKTGHSMAYDTAHHRTVLHEGFQTWELDGQRWEQISACASTDLRTMPAQHRMVYDEARRCLVLHGNGETWEAAAPATNPCIATGTPTPTPTHPPPTAVHWIPNSATQAEGSDLAWRFHVPPQHADAVEGNDSEIGLRISAVKPGLAFAAWESPSIRLPQEPESGTDVDGALNATHVSIYQAQLHGRKHPWRTTGGSVLQTWPIVRLRTTSVRDGHTQITHSPGSQEFWGGSWSIIQSVAVEHAAPIDMAWAWDAIYTEPAPPSGTMQLDFFDLSHVRTVPLAPWPSFRMDFKDSKSHAFTPGTLYSDPELDPVAYLAATPMGLAIRASDEQQDSGDAVYFGFWQGRIGSFVPWFRLYRVTYTVGSDATPEQRDEVPAFRLRLGEVAQQVSSANPASRIPTRGNSQTYHLWAMSKSELYVGISGFLPHVAFDLIAAPSDDPTITLYLESIEVRVLGE